MIKNELHLTFPGLVLDFSKLYYENPKAKHIKEFQLSQSVYSGMFLWIFGFLGNFHSDRILLNLRKPGESGYKIPRGGLFEYVSGANFFAEIVEWWGLAVASGFSLPCVCFAIQASLTAGTRACASHR